MIKYTYPGRPNGCGGYHRTKYENGEWVTERTRCSAEAPTGQAQCSDCAEAERRAVVKRKPAPESGANVAPKQWKKAGNW